MIALDLMKSSEVRKAGHQSKSLKFLKLGFPGCWEWEDKKWEFKKSSGRSLFLTLFLDMP